MDLSVCEEMQLAQMAEAAGEESSITSEQVRRHIASCENCRNQVIQLQEIDQLLMRQTFGELDVNLWTNIRQQLTPEPSSVGWQPFAIVAALLTVFKLVEMAAGAIPALLFNLVPLLLMFVLFSVIKENPFRINSNIALEK